jgi:hypothetical protein
MDIVLSSQTTNFYAEQAQTQGSSYAGLSPGYYDHFEVRIEKGIFEFNRPIKDTAGYEPFTPADTFNLRSKSGDQITHLFVGLEVTPVGYFIGGSLSNYDQVLPNERKGGHCETIRAELELGEEKKAIVQGRYPVQSSQGIHYSFKAYNKDATAPGVYAGKRFMTYGKATPQYAAETGRAEVISCQDCVERKLDSYQKNTCRTSGVFAVYVTKVAIKGADGKIVWLTVEELGIEELGSSFVAVLKVGGADLRKPNYSLTSRANFHLPPNVTFAHDYVTRLYRQNEPELSPIIETDYGIMQTLANPTQIWIGELTNPTGSIKQVALYNCAPVGSTLTLEQKHLDLQVAIKAYFNDKAAKLNQKADLKVIDEPIAQPVAKPIAAAPVVASVAPVATANPNIGLSQLDAASKLFSGFSPKS